MDEFISYYIVGNYLHLIGISKYSQYLELYKLVKANR